MMIRSLITSLLFTFFLVLTSSPIFAQDATPDGKAIFRAQCASCHVKDMKSNLTGPALGGVEERWADYPQEDLYAWIRNSQKMIADGHPKALELWAEWGPTVMTAFPNLTDADIAELLLYINGVYTGEGKYAPPPPPEGEIAATGAGDSGTSPAMMFLLFGVLAVFAVVLARIVSNLNHMTAVQAGEEAPPRKTLVELLTSKPVIGFVIFAAVVLGGYTTVNNAIEMGRQQNYMPDQPIKFSHETHAGLNKIDCQYCHDSARRSKHASIPAVNTCMNCHTAIKVGSEYGTEELTKIYASAGWNPNTGLYIEDYQNARPDSIRAVFEKWIDESYRLGDGEGKKESAIVREVKRQLEGLEPFIQKPIMWNRIHNLPDHVYFNHAQHVTVGKVECQTCHGKVEEMPVLGQYAPLSMGWCINCHRETEVKFADNDYYTKSYEQYHKDLQSGNVDKISVEDIGGLECQKCHY